MAKALPLAQRAMELDSDLAESHAALGFVHHQQQNYQAALESWSRAVELNPSSAMNHTWLGTLFANIGNFEQEIESRKLAAKLDPLSAVVLNNYAVSLFTRDRFSESDLVLERMKTVDLTFYNYTCSWQAWQRGKPAEALIYQLKIEDKTPGDRRAWGRLTNMFGLLGFRQEAMRYAQNSNRLMMLAYVWFSDLTQAAVVATENYEDSTDDPQLLVEMALAVLAVGDVDLAARHFERYMERFEDGVGPNDEIAGFAALMRKAKGDEAGIKHILRRLNDQLARGLSGGLNSHKVKLLRLMTAVLEDRSTDALAALETISRGPGLTPQFVSSLQHLTPLSEDPYFEEILRRQAIRFAQEREKFLTYLKTEDKFENWQPLPTTLSSQE